MLDAWSAKFAAPGMANPDDQSSTLTGQPSQEVIDRDYRVTVSASTTRWPRWFVVSSEIRNWAGTKVFRSPS